MHMVLYALLMFSMLNVELIDIKKHYSSIAMIKIYRANNR